MPKPAANPTKALTTVLAALEPLALPDRQWVLQSAASRWMLPVPTPPGGGGLPGSPGGGNAPDAQAAITAKNVRTFVKAKKPGNDAERVACLGYYIMQTTAHPGFARKHINEAHTNSGGSNINMTRALDNATRKSKYLSNRGKREKQLTTLGEDVVEALPDRAAVAAVLAQAKTRKRGPRGKKATKTA
jgi:hypothetical protein